MNRENKNKQRRYYKTSALLFILFLVLFVGANIITKDKTFSEIENRMLAGKPKFSVDRLLEGRFTSKFEDYEVDQFIGRDFFTNVKINMDKLLGKKESNGVFLGEDGYLIENFNKPNEEAVKENLQAINNFSARYKNIKQYMLISPTAVSILKNKLPIDAPVIDQEAYLQSYKDKLPQSVSFVDNYKTMHDHRNEYIYYKTDHHWTCLGAFYSYKELAKSMKLEETPDDYYTQQMVSNDFFGALSSKSGYNVKEGDKVNVYLPAKEDSQNVVVNYAEEQERTATLYSSEALEQKDNYEVFLKGNHPLVKIKTDANNNKTLLIFKDSYANSFIPFLIKDFSKIIVVDPRYYYEDIDSLMQQENVNEVLYLYNANTFFNDTSLSPVLNNE
ncbi:DHHW family protein [Terrisporobacter vanillatitrophus]|uniref:DHHW family protein n=1 Tax=Terrisporobacter vanillatitrophus TaxID=3058402 RepID=UPI0033665F56